MITISLDEYGLFEKSSEKINDAVFIGGVMYDDNGVESDSEIEAMRIAAYYRAVMEKLNDENTNPNMHYSYPRALHCGDGVGPMMVANTKNLVAQTLPEFIRYGTFEGKELVSKGLNGINIPLLKRNGKYYLYLILKSDEGKKDRLGDKANFLVDDEFASNLYFHMSSELFSRIVFNNPVIADNSVFSLQIATRTSGNLLKGGEASKEYELQGYTAIDKSNNKEVKTKDKQPGVFYKVTTGDVYRTVIEQLLMENPDSKNSIKELRVESINYNTDKFHQEFLYLADSVCSILSFELNKHAKTADKFLNEIIKRSEPMVDAEDMVYFAYDSIDIWFDKAVQAYKNGDFFKALEIMHTAEKSESKFAKFYKKRWFSYVHQMMETSGNPEYFRRAVRELELYRMRNKYSQELGLYILNALEKMVPYVKVNLVSPESQVILYSLYECGLAIYNHNGDAKKAEEYFSKMTAYASRVSSEDYLRARNLLVVSYCDSLEWNKALHMAGSNVIYQEHIAELKREISETLAAEGFTEQSKTISQLGQVYAFMGNDKAEEVFVDALNHLTYKSANYYITLSYLLHYYISSGNKEMYERYADEYFGGNSNRIKQLDYIFTEGFKQDPIFNHKFALYVYLKSLYIFDNESITAELWDKLRNIEKYVNENYADVLSKPWRLNYHPSEMIVKYLRLLAVERMDKEAEMAYALIHANSEGECKGALLEAIWHMCNAEVWNAKRKKSKRDKEAEEAYNICRDAFRTFKRSKVSKEDTFEYMKKSLSYMYC